MENNGKRKTYNIAHAVTAMVISAVIYVIILMICKITPFGSATWIIEGSGSQYADYLAYYRTMVTGINDLFYSFDGSLGRSMVGIIAYYLTSPFLIITLVFSEADLPVALTLITGLKLISAAFTFDLLLQRLCGKSTYLCSVTYALTGYMILNAPNMMWLDMLIVLPIAMITLEALIRDGKLLGYTICIAVILYLNYYIGYMAMAFMLLWTFARLFALSDKGCQEAVMRWGIASLAGVGIDAFILVPALLELREVSLGYDLSYVQTADMIWYCGLTASVCAVMFFFCRKIAIRERIGMFVLTITLVISCTWDKASFIWHFMYKSRESAFPEAFIFIVITLICAGRFLGETDAIHGKRITAFIICSFMIILQFADLIFNDVRVYKGAVAGKRTEEYAASVSVMDKAVSAVKEKDNGFWRMEDLNPIGHNDGLLHDYRNISYAGTSELSYSRDFLGRLGYDTGSGYVAYGHDNTMTADSILGIRYVLSDPAGEYTVHKDYNRVVEGDRQVYINPYALPLAVGVYREMSGDAADPFAMQEDIYGRLAGEPVDIFIPAQSEYIETDNSRPVREYHVTAEASGEMYFYVSDIMSDDVSLEIYLNDEYLCCFGKDTAAKVINLGYHKKGDFLLIHMIAEDSAELGNAIFVTEDKDALRNAYERTLSRQGKVGVIKSSSLYITIDSAYTVGDDISGEIGVFTTIPYQKGWRAKVAGVKVEPIEVYDALVYIPITEALQQAELGPDENIRVELSYVPDGFYFGIMISLVSVFIIALMAIIKNSEAGFFGEDYDEDDEDGSIEEE